MTHGLHTIASGVVQELRIVIAMVMNAEPRFAI
jgi:hypothetical protein